MEADASVARQQAKQFPRDERKILKDSLAELELVPETAEKAYYSIPFVDGKAGKTTLVQGLSIGSALGLARRWGNCASTVRCLNEDPGGWDLEGGFIDFENNFHCGRPIRGSKLLKTKTGQVYTLDERRASMAFGAHASKAQRNAVLAALPNYLKEAYFAKARQIVGGAPDAPAEAKKVEACLKAFGRFNVTEPMLVTYLGVDKAKWTGEDVANLRGLWAAINDDNISVADAFQIKPEEAASQSAILTPESLGTTATVKAENDPKDRGGKHPVTV